MDKKWLPLLILGGVIFWLSRQKTISTSTSAVGQPSGLGVGGRPRMGVPKTELERLASHQARFGVGSLPPRGSGLKRQGLIW